MTYQASKKTDFTVDFLWWGSLRLAPINDNQYEFCKRRSAELQLIYTIHDFAYNLNDRKQTNAILLDFCKAFDKVPHHYLKLKLDYNKVTNQILKWISSFLEECTQCVVAMWWLYTRSCKCYSRCPTEHCSGTTIAFNLYK